MSEPAQRAPELVTASGRRISTTRSDAAVGGFAASTRAPPPFSVPVEPAPASARRSSGARARSTLMPPLTHAGGDVGLAVVGQRQRDAAVDGLERRRCRSRRAAPASSTSTPPLTVEASTSCAARSRALDAAVRRARVNLAVQAVQRDAAIDGPQVHDHAPGHLDGPLDLDARRPRRVAARGPRRGPGRRRLPRASRSCFSSSLAASSDRGLGRPLGHQLDLVPSVGSAVMRPLMLMSSSRPPCRQRIAARPGVLGPARRPCRTRSRPRR